MDYRVQLDIYKGPLDLLLYLIQENEVEIHDIPIAIITDQYLRHLEIIRMLDPNLAGEFLVMASTLMEIKSRMLLPLPEREEDEEEQGDPRIELIRQLMEYKKYKEAAAMLAERREEQLERFGRGARGRFEGLGEEQEELEVAEVTIWDILSAFDRVMRQTLRLQPATIVDRDVPVRRHIEHILRMLRVQGVITFLTIFETCEDRIEAIGKLLALLEMARARVVGLAQTVDGAEIRIKLLSEENVPKLLRGVSERRVSPEEARQADEAPEATDQPTEPVTTGDPEPEAASTEPAHAESPDVEEEADEDLEEIRRVEVHDVQLGDEDTPTTENDESRSPNDDSMTEPE